MGVPVGRGKNGPTVPSVERTGWAVVCAGPNPALRNSRYFSQRHMQILCHSPVQDPMMPSGMSTAGTYSINMGWDLWGQMAMMNVETEEDGRHTNLNERARSLSRLDPAWTAFAARLTYKRGGMRSVAGAIASCGRRLHWNGDRDGRSRHDGLRDDKGSLVGRQSQYIWGGKTENFIQQIL